MLSLFSVRPVVNGPLETISTLTVPATPDGSDGIISITWDNYRKHVLQKLQVEITLNSGEYIKVGNGTTYGPTTYTLTESDYPVQATFRLNGNTGHTYTIKGKLYQTGYGPIHEGLPDFEQYIGKTEWYAPDPVNAKIYTLQAGITYSEGQYAYDSLGYLAVQPSLVNILYGASDTVTPRSFATCYLIRY